MSQATTKGAAAPGQTSTPYVFSGWQPWYQGVDRAVGTADLAFDVSPPVARKQYVNALRVDLANEAVSFLTTPAAPPSDTSYQTLGDTIDGFLAKNPEVMVAINANFSWAAEIAVNANFSLLGLAVSRGDVVCDPTKPAPQPGGTTYADVPDQTCAGAMAMLISQANEVTFQLVTQANPPQDLSRTYTAIAGSPQPTGTGWPPCTDVPNWPPQARVAGPTFLVDGGDNMAAPQEFPAEEIAGRTAVGLSADGRYLYLVTLDGCEGAAWTYGGGFRDIAQWLVIAGASTGINLDGGGSTAMACRDSAGTPVLMNIPFGDETKGPAGVRRAVGNYFGVATQPLS